MFTRPRLHANEANYNFTHEALRSQCAHRLSVNSGIPKTHYLDNEFQLRLPGIDRLREFIVNKGSGCYVYKKDL